MDSSPLVTEEIDAGAEFLKRLNVHLPVRAACWLREDENELRYLFAALDGLTAENTDVAYREVLRISTEMTEHYIDPFRVKLIRTDHPVARAVIELHQQCRGRFNPRPNSRVFAGSAVEDVYIYPEAAVLV